MRWTLLLVVGLLASLGCPLAMAQEGIPPGPPCPAQQSLTPEGGNDIPTCAPSSHPRIPLEVSWDNGLRLESADEQFSLHVGGVGQIDTVWLIGPQSLFAPTGGGSSSSNGVANAQATLLRRAILQADGTIFGM